MATQQQRRYRVAILAVMIVLLAVVATRSGNVTPVPPEREAISADNSDLPFGPDLLVSDRDRNPHAPPLGGIGRTIGSGLISAPGAVAEEVAAESLGEYALENEAASNSIAASDFPSSAAPGWFPHGTLGVSRGFINTSWGGAFGVVRMAPASFAASGTQSADWLGSSGGTARALGVRAGSLELAQTNVPQTGSVEPAAGQAEPPTVAASGPVALLVEGPPLDLKGAEPGPADLQQGDPLAPDTHASSGPPPPRVVNPEPASVLLLGTGLTLVARGLRRRRR